MCYEERIDKIGIDKSFYYYSHVHNSLQHTSIGHQCLVSGGLALILGVYQRLPRPTDVFHGSCSQDIYLCANL